MLSEEELTASEAAAFLQSAADARGHIEKEDVPLERVEIQPDVSAESFSVGGGQLRPPHVEGFNRPVLSHSERVYTRSMFPHRRPSPQQPPPFPAGTTLYRRVRSFTSTSIGRGERHENKLTSDRLCA